MTPKQTKKEWIELIVFATVFLLMILLMGGPTNRF